MKGGGGGRGAEEGTRMGEDESAIGTEERSEG